MKSFLEEVVQHILKQSPNLQNTLLILPSKRAGTFVKHYFLKYLHNTSFAPTIYSIEEFIALISGLQYASEVELLFEFYSAYSAITNKEKKESFEAFIAWAPTVLQDFNEIDRHLVEHKTIFSSLSSIQDLNHWSLNNKKTELQEKHLTFWKGLNELYESFTQKLLQKGIGYQGLVYKEAVNVIEHYIQANLKTTHYFIGFNALNKAEELIIQEVLSSLDAHIFWDTDVFYLDNPVHEAGMFMREHQKKWKYFQQHPFNWTYDNYSQEKNIQIIGCPKNLSQANYIGKLLKENTFLLKNTAIVLGNEQLLNVTLNAVPKNINGINITMGAPLNQTPLASFFTLLFQLHIHKKAKGWYYDSVLQLLSHPYAQTLCNTVNSQFTYELTQSIQKNNWVYITPQMLLLDNGGSLLLFTNISNANHFINNSIQLIYKLKEIFSNHKKKHRLALEYLFRFLEVFNQLSNLNETYGQLSTIESLYSIYKQLLSSVTLDYQGEPLEGLQIMGMLESRNLDFETIILSGVNEGMLPAGKSYNSFIPFDVKLIFNLPTYKEKDAVYAYHFYRLLQRAKNIYLLYNTEPDVLEGGENSRFLLQIVHDSLPNHTITNTIAAPTITTKPKQLLEIKKEASLLQALQTLANKGFSPSALTNYVRNPIDFYYQSVLKIRQQDEVEETVAANTLGTIVHNALEELYTPLVNKTLTVEAIKTMLSKSSTIVETAFKKEYSELYYKEGKNYLVFHAAQQYVKNLLIAEMKDVKQGANIVIKALEKEIKTSVSVSNLNFSVNLKGVVDRIDERNGITRIIDYKTGKVEANQLIIYDWNLLLEDYKYSKAFQVLMYSYMLNTIESLNFPVEAGIISLKNLQLGFLKFGLKDAPRSKNNETQITHETLTSFEVFLKMLIAELFDASIPFIEKELEEKK